MDDEQYTTISGYLEHGTYLAGFTKSQKFVLEQFLVDVTERCNLCGGDKNSMLHQDYTHWVRQYAYAYMYSIAS